MYRTLFNQRIGKFRVYGDIESYISFGVTFGTHMFRIDFGPFGVGLLW